MRSILLLALVRSRSRFDRCEERSEDVVRVWLEGEDPRMEEMLEWAQRACFRIAEVTVMHSVTTSDTGSMATGMDAIPGPRGGNVDVDVLIRPCIFQRRPMVWKWQEKGSRSGSGKVVWYGMRSVCDVDLVV